jgi:hypothetical protein
MLKLLLLSGWFRLQPVLNYLLLVVLIAPLVAASGRSSAARQSKVVAKITNTPSAVASMNEPYLVELLTTPPITASIKKSQSSPLLMAAIRQPQLLKTDTVGSLLANDFRADGDIDPALAAVELAPTPEIISLSQKRKSSSSQRLNGEFYHEVRIAKSLRNAPIQIEPNLKPEAPSVEELDEAQIAEFDPLGSPHPIPWKWILATQEAISANGGSGVRHYRSVPVTSPDGRFIVYSRVQLEVRPEMYQSRVTSVMFVEDTKTKRLRVMTSTAPLSDPLLDRNESSRAEVDIDTSGQIGVLVPVSWSEQSDRFLARKFEGRFNTGDSTDQAVIWDRQKNHVHTVAPTRAEHEHEKIAVLLGWSKNKPDHALFRAGEIGDEKWPLVQVATDGKTENITDADQPITFGPKITEVWGDSQFASR